mgnify:CR=1 FL=1
MIKDYMVSQKPSLNSICAEPFRNGGSWQGFFEPRTVLFRYERERVLTDTIKTVFFIQCAF